MCLPGAERVILKPKAKAPRTAQVSRAASSFSARHRFFFSAPAARYADTLERSSKIQYADDTYRCFFLVAGVLIVECKCNIAIKIIVRVLSIGIQIATLRNFVTP